MAELFIQQAKQYAEARPSYPLELIEFIASKTIHHDLAWDVGTGSGQAAKSLAGIYKNVIATDTSKKQLDFAPKISNVRYEQTPPVMSMAELEQIVASEGSIDVVTIAQALHWFDLPYFYEQVKWILKKPHGVIATWCYTVPEVNDSVDSVFRQLYAIDSKPYCEPPARRLVAEMYKSIDFPFEAVDGTIHTGPFEFETKRMMNFDEFFTYIRSWSAYQTAKEKGVELLKNEVIEEFERAWNEDGKDEKIVRYPVYLRIGRMGNA